MIDETTTTPERVGFCQDCGRPLTRETVRTVGSGVFCEPCLEIRLSAANAAAAGATAGPATGAGYVPPVPPVGGFGSVPPGTMPQGSMPPGTMPPLGGDNPNPVLAGFLGLIPGVGAMYNGQFAKGIAHIIIFALIQSMARVSDVFGFLAFIWCLYQAYEAYHTARARREGRPLPDPFNLNNIGDHLGFTSNGRANGTGQPFPNWSGFTSPGQSYTAVPNEPIVPPPPPQNWGSVPVTPPVGAYTQAPPPAWTVPPPPAPDWVSTPPVYAPPTVPVVPASRFPATAVWLIGLGVVFLLLTLDSDRVSAAHAIPFFLAAFAVWIFTRRMSTSGGLMPMEDEGAAYTSRVVCRMRAPVILLVTAVLLGLQSFHLVSFGSSWPVLVIAFGVVLLVERAFPRAVIVPTYVPPAGFPGSTADDAAKGGL